MFWLNPYVFGTAVGSPWPQSSLADLHGKYMGLLESYGTCTRFSWEFHGTIWGSPWGVQGAAMALPRDSLGTPWDYSAAMGHPSVFRATYVGPPWYFQSIPALPCNFHGTSMGFHGILWDFNALAWDCHESPRNPTDHKINMSASDTYIKYKQWWPFFRTDGPTFLTRCAVPNAACSSISSSRTCFGTILCVFRFRRIRTHSVGSGPFNRHNFPTLGDIMSEPSPGRGHYTPQS